MTADSIVSLLYFAVVVAIIVAALSASLEDSDSRHRRERIALQGIEVEAEILGRFEAGALQGSKLSMARVPYMASWDPRAGAPVCLRRTGDRQPRPGLDRPPLAPTGL